MIFSTGTQRVILLGNIQLKYRGKTKQKVKRKKLNLF
jgi:hypothetical protein